MIKLEKKIVTPESPKPNQGGNNCGQHGSGNSGSRDTGRQPSTTEPMERRSINPDKGYEKKGK